MPGMPGCKNYTTMCSNVSVVKECHMQVGAILAQIVNHLIPPPFLWVS